MSLVGLLEAATRRRYIDNRHVKPPNAATLEARR
jgi:hypothetical protein